MTNHSANRYKILAGVVSLLSLQAGIAAAQDVKPATADTSMTEVTVTATRRSEPLQKVPVAVSVFTGDQMRDANLNGLRDISSAVPSFNFRVSASYKDQALFLRGLGTSATSSAVEPSVSTVIDGVVLGRQGQASLDLLDVDRIEVLRGPQGTLFGKNSSAGVLNIITKAPTEEFHGYGDLGYYEGNEWRLRGGLSGALVSVVIVIGTIWSAK